MKEEIVRRAYNLSVEDLYKPRNKKVMIMTLLYTVSVGAVLQAQALQQTLNDLGIDNVFGDYKCYKVYRDSLPLWKKKQETFTETIKALLKYPIQKKRYEKFRRYEKEHLNILDGEFTGDDLMMKMKKDGIASLLIGSDQVWNMELTDRDNVFFGRGCIYENSLYSYAASIGTDRFPFEYEAYRVRDIAGFAGINVREKSAQEYLMKKGVENVSCGIDPTLLVEKEKWEEQIGEREIKEPYILVHMMEEAEENFAFLRNLAKKTGRKIYWMNNRLKGCRGIKMLRTAGPQDFLNYIYYADYVVTGSFHGLCFSLLFQKEFYYTKSPEWRRNLRITDLAALFDFTHREIVKGEVQSEKPVDFVAVERIRKKEKEKSLEYLSMLKQGLGSDVGESL